MSQPDRLSEIPRIIVEGDKRKSSYFLKRGEETTEIGAGGMRVITILNKEVPDLVYASSLISLNTATFSRTERWLAETMYALSQPDMLGDLLQWEEHGRHIVGYRLTQAIEVVDHRQLPAPEPEHRPFWWLTIDRPSQA